MPEWPHGAAPAADFLAALNAYRRRLRLAALAVAILLGAVVAGLIASTLAIIGLFPWSLRIAALAALILVATVCATLSWRRSTSRRAAATIESRLAGTDNLIITAEEVASRRHGPLHPLVHGALFSEARARLASTTPAAIQPIARVAALAAAAVMSVLALIIYAPIAGERERANTTTVDEGGAVAPLAPGDLRVTVTPPAYTGRSTASTINPTEVVAIEGSRIRLESARIGGRVQLAEAGKEPVLFDAAQDSWVHEFTASDSRVLLVQRPELSGQRDADRLLQLRVDPDRRPLVQIRSPAKDLIFGEPTGTVPIEIDARDDIGLASLALKYTRVSGSGESFTFQEGDLPLTIKTDAEGTWHAQATVSLEALALEDGDTLVYRAVATDRKPGADPSASESFLIEVGRLAGVASTGFALPEDRDRQALSQQMLIMKTERLIAERSKLTPAAFTEQAQMLAIEQRMVKAEFVFMTGGHVEDEVAEAEHSHELAEGRMENAAQVELLTAIREMSRAEARLNASDAAQGLVFERAALNALQRAFDRRRYLLRTLPERARVDLERRLTGDLAAARSSTRAAADPAVDETILHARDALIALGGAMRAPDSFSAALGARVLMVDPTSEKLQKAVVALSSASDVSVRLAAAHDAQRLLAEIIRANLGAGPEGRIVRDPLSGRIAGESPGQRGRQ